MLTCFAAGLHISTISFATIYCVLGVYCIESSRFSSFCNPNLLPWNIQFIAFAQAAFIVQDACIQIYNLILPNGIGYKMLYRESKKLVFSGVSKRLRNMLV